MAKIDANGKHINSGFCSGNKNVTTGLKSGVCKGTVQSYNGARELDSINSGAFSGNNSRCHSANGTVGDNSETGSEVMGTQRSFNVGIPPTGDKSFQMIDKNWSTCKADNCLSEEKIETYGTRGSFNATGEDSKIAAYDATINSGYGADSKNILSKIQNIQGYTCRGTVQSFNAKGDREQIIIERATLNTGAFAGSAQKK